MKQRQQTEKEAYDQWFSENYETGFEYGCTHPQTLEKHWVDIPNKLDTYMKDTISEILEHGTWDKDPRPKWADGTPAQTKKVHNKVFTYNLAEGEYPITTLRTTPFRGCFEELSWIYQKQSSVLEDACSSIYWWWKDFTDESGSIGKRYGNTVRRYNLMNKLLIGLEINPFGRRHIVDLYQYQEFAEDPTSLYPCAYSTTWNVREQDGTRYLDVVLNQRSMDFVMVSGINALEYAMLIAMVAGHLTSSTGIGHQPGVLTHVVANCHVYDRHMGVAEKLIATESLGQPEFTPMQPKNFYDYGWEDLKIEKFEAPKYNLELAV